jgi:hypothetical protein
VLEETSFDNKEIDWILFQELRWIAMVTKNNPERGFRNVLVNRLSGRKSCGPVLAMLFALICTRSQSSQTIPTMVPCR